MRKIINKLIQPKSLFILTLLLFSFQSFYFLITVKSGVAPDENYHLNLSVLHSKQLSPILEESEETYIFGALSTNPYLYHYILGFFSYLNLFKLPLILHLRFSSIFFGIVTLIYIYKLTQEITFNKYAPVLATFLMTNTLMFAFLGGMVNYDNLVTLLFTAAVFYLVKLYKTNNYKFLFATLIFLLLGNLTKATFIPLTFILGLTILVILFRRHSFIFASFAEQLKKQPLLFTCLVLVVSILTLMNLHLYGTNFAKYGDYSPSCDAVIGHDQCYSHNGPYHRNYDLRNDGKETSPRLKDALDWVTIYSRSTYGIHSHNPTYFNEVSRLPLSIMVLMGLYSLVINRKRINKIHLTLSIIIGFFVILVFIYNYIEYLDFGIWIATQGRYLFPSLALGYILLSYSIFMLKKTKLRDITIFSLALLLFCFGFLLYFINPREDFKLDWNEISDEHHPYYEFKD